jgi:hypothetical protein
MKLGESRMSNRSIREYAEIAGIVAVVVSLALVAFEIRQNTLAIQTSALQQHYEQHTALILARLDNAELRTAVSNGNDGLAGLSNSDFSLYGPYAANMMRSHFIAFELMRTGLLPEAQWRTFQAALGRMLERSQGDRELWVLRRGEYPDEFQSLVDALIVEDGGASN